MNLSAMPHELIPQELLQRHFRRGCKVVNPRDDLQHDHQLNTELSIVKSWVGQYNFVDLP